MTVVDASVWVSVLSEGELDHEVSRVWLALESKTGVTIPTLALAEAAGAVARRTGSPADGQVAYATLLATPGLRIMTVDADVGREAAEIAASHRLRGADAVYVAVARLLALPLATLDREMQERAAPLVKIVIPGQATPIEDTVVDVETDQEDGR
jgi:predicted nucleic acid-binding protein